MKTVPIFRKLCGCVSAVCLLAPWSLQAQTRSSYRSDSSKYETWITGEVFTENNILLFRADKAVRGNPTGKVVLLGSNREAAGVLLPAYLKAAEKHTKLRLYGVLIPSPDKPAKGVPSVEFITWKLHLPSDLDELPANQKITIRPGDTVKGTVVHIHPK